MKKIIIITILLSYFLITNQVSSVVSSCLQLKYTLSMRSEDINTKGEVSKLQQFLKNQGYYKAEISGFYGRATALALINFQRANGIPIDRNPWSSAIIGPKTAKKISDLTCPISIIKTTPIPTPTITPTPTPTPTVTISPKPSINPSPTPMYSPTPTYSPSPSYSPTPTQSASPSPTYSPTPTYSPSPTPTSTQSPKPSSSSSPYPSSSASAKTYTSSLWEAIMSVPRF